MTHIHNRYIIVLVPAVIIAALALFIRFIQFEPIIPKELTERAKQKQDSTGLQIPIYPEDPIIGNHKAPLTLIAFEDFGCSHCQELSIILNQLLEKYPNKIKIIWKGLAVTQFPVPTDLAHEYAYCADREGKFSEFASFAFVNGDNLTEDTLKEINKSIGLKEKSAQECLESGLAKTHNQKNTMLATFLNIQSVPTMFFNNKQINPPNDLAGWQAVLGL